MVARETIQKTQNEMHRVLDFVRKELSGLRIGRASATLLDGIQVNAYNARMPINQVATVSTPQPNLIMVQPWDKTLAGEIGKAILASNLGLNPVTDATGVRIPIPPLSEERRREVVKVAHKIAEQGRVEIREMRRKANEDIKKAEKEKRVSEDDMHHVINDIQKQTDNAIREVDNLLAAKEKEIME